MAGETALGGSKMRVVIFGKCPPLEGGVSSRTFRFVRGLAALGHKVTYITNARAAGASFQAALDEEDARYLADALEGVELIEIGKAEGMLHIPYSPAFETRLIGAGVAAVKQADLVVGWYYQPYGVAAAILAERFGKPCFLVHAGSDIGKLALSRELQAAYQSLFANAWLITVRPVADLIAKRIVPSDPQRIMVLSPAAATRPYLFATRPQPLDIEHLRRYTRPHLDQWEIAPDRRQRLLDLNSKNFDSAIPTLGIYGKIGEVKGNHNLVQALKLLADKGKRFNFVMCGGGQPRQITAFVDALLASDTLSARSWLFPFIAPWRVPAFIATCDAIAFLERDFPVAIHMPTVPREVLSIGAALICSGEIAGKQSFRTKLSDRKNFIDAGDPKNVEALSNAIDFALSDRARLRDIASAGQQLMSAYPEAVPSQDPIILALRERGFLA